MPDAFNEWLSEINDDDMTAYIYGFMRQIDKRIPGGINWWREGQTFIPKIK